MSFGFSPSDIITLIALTTKAYSGWRDACAEYADITGTLDNLRRLLRQLAKHVPSQSSTSAPAIAPESGFAAEEALRQDLAAVVREANRTVQDVDQVLGKFTSLSSSKRRNWDRIRFGTKDINGLRGRLAQHVSSIAGFLTVVELETIGSVNDNVNAMPDVILQRLPLALSSFIDSRVDDNISTRHGSCMTAYSNDDRHVWRAFRRECVKSGIKSDDIKQHRPELRRFFKKLVSEDKKDISEITEDKSGMLDVSDEEETEPLPHRTQEPSMPRTTSTQYIVEAEGVRSPPSHVNRTSSSMYGEIRTGGIRLGSPRATSTYPPPPEDVKYGSNKSGRDSLARQQESTQPSAAFKQSEEHSTFEASSNGARFQENAGSHPSLRRFQGYVESTEESDEDDEHDQTPLEESSSNVKASDLDTQRVNTAIVEPAQIGNPDLVDEHVDSTSPEQSSPTVDPSQIATSHVANIADTCVDPTTSKRSPCTAESVPFETPHVIDVTDQYVDSIPTGQSSLASAPDEIETPHVVDSVDERGSPIAVERSPPMTDSLPFETPHVSDITDDDHVPAQKRMPVDDYYLVERFTAYYNNTPDDRGFIITKKRLPGRQNDEDTGCASTSTSNPPKFESAMSMPEPAPQSGAPRASRPTRRSAATGQRKESVDAASHTATRGGNRGYAARRASSPIRPQRRNSESMTLLPLLSQRLGIISRWVKDCSQQDIVQATSKPSCMVCGAFVSPDVCAHEVDFVRDRCLLAIGKFTFGAEEAPSAEKYVLDNARNQMLLAFTCLEKRRTLIHTMYLQRLPNYSYESHRGTPPSADELLTLHRSIEAANGKLQASIDYEWRRTWQLLPLVLDYYLALKYAEVVQRNAGSYYY